MKRFFQVIGLVTLICFSFIYTNQTVQVVQEVDEIMVSIKKESKNYNIEPVNAEIKDKTIVPGLTGEEVNQNKSYYNMKKYGSFNPNLFEFKTLKPRISINKNFDKYIISGNADKKMVSLIFVVEQNDNINQILKILKDKKVKANFFVDGYWLEKNNDKLTEIALEGHNIGNLSYNMDYSNSAFQWMDTIIKKVSDSKIGYCYNEKDNDNNLKICSLYHNYTIRPNVIVKTYPLQEIKANLKAGSIISLPINNTVVNELPSIITHINSKGYKITTLNVHLSEKR